jgi:hypothetical protein
VRAPLAFLIAVPLAAQQPTIKVSPNILVTRAPGVEHAEVYVAAHPRDASSLVGMATTMRDVGSRVMLELYATSDGGQTWTSSIPSHQITNGGGDPIVGVSAQGTALGVALGHGMWAYRSEDGGLTWDAGRRAGSGDHERLGVDYSPGAYAGRLYLAAEVGDGKPTPDSIKRAVSVWRSHDDGRSWIGPVTAAREPVHGIAVNGLVVLSDGTVALFLNKYPNPGKDMTTPTWEMQLTTSSDGGVTFTPPRSIGTQYFNGYADLRRRQAAGRMDNGGGFDVAADANRTRFRDRMYMVYSEMRKADDGARIVARWSADKGATWSTPVNVAPESRAAVSQFQPAIAVNKDGTAAVIWYDTRDANGREEFNVYFAASVDGGRSWSTPARISSAPSRPFASGNVRPVPLIASQTANDVRVTMISAFSRWPNGGDYIGLAADANGVFHPFWTDARSGTYEVYSSRVEVSAGAVTLASSAPRALERRTVNEQVTLDLDPVTVDWEEGELLVPVRLKNVSRDTVYGPLSVEVKAICARACGAADSARVMNATNGARGAGAIMNYAGALRDLDALAPGALTEAITWRVKMATLRHSDLSITAVITGEVKHK